MRRAHSWSAWTRGLVRCRDRSRRRVLLLAGFIIGALSLGTLGLACVLRLLFGERGAWRRNPGRLHHVHVGLILGRRSLLGNGRRRNARLCFDRLPARTGDDQALPDIEVSIGKVIGAHDLLDRDVIAPREARERVALGDLNAPPLRRRQRSAPDHRLAWPRIGGLLDAPARRRRIVVAGTWAIRRWREGAARNAAPALRAGRSINRLRRHGD